MVSIWFPPWFSFGIKSCATFYTTNIKDYCLISGASYIGTHDLPITIVVTHSSQIAAQSDVVFRLSKGMLTKDSQATE